MYVLLNFFLFVKVSYLCELQQNLHVLKPYSTFVVFQPALLYNILTHDSKCQVLFILACNLKKTISFKILAHING